MDWYAINEVELKQFYMAALLAAGDGKVVAEVVNGITARKIKYRRAAPSASHNTARDAIALVTSLHQAVSTGVQPGMWYHANRALVEKIAQQHP